MMSKAKEFAQFYVTSRDVHAQREGQKLTLWNDEQAEEFLERIESQIEDAISDVAMQVIWMALQDEEQGDEPDTNYNITFFKQGGA